MSSIISLMGIDGSGKSTLANNLAVQLNSGDEHAVVVWATLRPVILKPVIKAAKFLLVRKHSKYANYSEHMQVKRAGMKKLSWTHGLLFVVMLIDYIPQVLCKVWWKKMRGYHVVCDRYYYDLVVDYGEHVGATIARVLDLVRWVTWLFPTPDLKYFIAVPPEVAFSRKDDIPAMQYLEERDSAYREVALQAGIVALNGCNLIDDNVAVILADMKQSGLIREHSH